MFAAMCGRFTQAYTWADLYLRNECDVARRRREIFLGKMNLRGSRRQTALRSPRLWGWAMTYARSSIRWRGAVIMTQGCYRTAPIVRPPAIQRPCDRCAAGAFFERLPSCLFADARSPNPLQIPRRSMFFMARIGLADLLGRNLIIANHAGHLRYRAAVCQRMGRGEFLSN
jgi:hypothetical protein